MPGTVALSSPSLDDSCFSPIRSPQRLTADGPFNPQSSSLMGSNSFQVMGISPPKDGSCATQQGSAMWLCTTKGQCEELQAPRGRGFTAMGIMDTFGFKCLFSQFLSSDYINDTLSATETFPSMGKNGRVRSRHGRALSPRHPRH